jgi:hypothetical protein
MNTIWTVDRCVTTDMYCRPPGTRASEKDCSNECILQVTTQHTAHTRSVMVDVGLSACLQGSAGHAAE